MFSITMLVEEITDSVGGVLRTDTMVVIELPQPKPTPTQGWTEVPNK